MTPEAPQPEQSPDSSAQTDSLSMLTEEAKAAMIAPQETGGQMVDAATDSAAKADAAREIITGIPEGLAPAATPEDAPEPLVVEPMPGTLPPAPEAPPAPPMAEPMPGTLTPPEDAPAPQKVEPMPVTPDSPAV